MFKSLCIFGVLLVSTSFGLPGATPCAGTKTPEPTRALPDFTDKKPDEGVKYTKCSFVYPDQQCYATSKDVTVFPGANVTVDQFLLLRQLEIQRSSNPSPSPVPAPVPAPPTGDQSPPPPPPAEPPRPEIRERIVEVPSEPSTDPLSEIAVSSHNGYRARHRSPGLSWNDQMAVRARSHADSCVWEHHSRGSSVEIGQNLYAETPSSPDNRIAINNALRNAVSAWYDEERFYNYNDATCNGGQCYHFTQLIWASTRNVACGVSMCNNGLQNIGNGPWIYVVCDYNSPGNVYVNGGISAFLENVVRPN